jgi:hypothetical protein
MGRFIESEQSPRWITAPSLSGALGVIALMVLHLLPAATHPYLAWAMVLVPLAAMGVLARSWHRRLPVTPHEREYVRVGIVVLSIAGLAGLSGGALPLTLVAGPAFWIWTVVESRRS